MDPPNLKCTLFCPINAVQNQWQEEKQIEKLVLHAQLGITLCLSSQYARSIILVLELLRGLV